MLGIVVTNISGCFLSYIEHASHVVMSVMKLLGSASNHKDDGLDDPLARFTLVLAAIVHDVDHPGVPNSQLNKEQHDMAMAYDCLSAAEVSFFHFICAREPVWTVEALSHARFFTAKQFGFDLDVACQRRVQGIASYHLHQRSRTTSISRAVGTYSIGDGHC